MDHQRPDRRLHRGVVLPHGWALTSVTFHPSLPRAALRQEHLLPFLVPPLAVSEPLEYDGRHVGARRFRTSSLMHRRRVSINCASEKSPAPVDPAHRFVRMMIDKGGTS